MRVLGPLESIAEIGGSLMCFAVPEGEQKSVRSVDELLSMLQLTNLISMKIE